MVLFKSGDFSDNPDQHDKATSQQFGELIFQGQKRDGWGCARDEWLPSL
jgi:hypothetical protein